MEKAPGRPRQVFTSTLICARPGTGELGEFAGRPVPATPSETNRYVHTLKKYRSFAVPKPCRSLAVRRPHGAGLARRMVEPAANDYHLPEH